MTPTDTSIQGITSHDRRYPVGQLVMPERITPADRLYAISCLAELPTHLRNAVDDLDEDQLETPYREGGWTVRQVVHHIADSHLNAVLRVKLALTSELPTINAYDENAWARLRDYEGPVEWSLELIESLHARWVMLLKSLDETQWSRCFLHPALGAFSVEKATQLYAWHSRHHVAHITHLRAREDW